MRRAGRVLALSAFLCLLLASRSLAGSAWPDTSSTVTAWLGQESPSLSADWTLRPLRWGDLRPVFEVGSHASLGTGSRPEWLRIAGSARLELSHGSGTAWLGSDLTQQFGLNPSASTWWFEAGERVALHRLTIMARSRYTRLEIPEPAILIWVWDAPPGFTSPPDVFPDVPYWQAQPPELTSVTVLESGVRWDGNRWELQATTGVGLAYGRSSVHLAGLSATHWVRGLVGVQLSWRGSEPLWMQDRQTPPHNLLVGLKLRFPLPDRTAPDEAEPARGSRLWEARARPGGRLRVRLYAPAVTEVDLRGDFSSWQTVPMAPDGHGWWEATIRVESGAHSVEVSFGGGPWGPPPGLPTTLGAYGEEVGLLLVEE